jgi:hypothetical protein
MRLKEKAILHRGVSIGLARFANSMEELCMHHACAVRVAPEM